MRRGLFLYPEAIYVKLYGESPSGLVDVYIYTYTYIPTLSVFMLRRCGQFNFYRTFEQRTSQSASVVADPSSTYLYYLNMIKKTFVFGRVLCWGSLYPLSSPIRLYRESFSDGLIIVPSFSAVRTTLQQVRRRFCDRQVPIMGSFFFSPQFLFVFGLTGFERHYFFEKKKPNGDALLTGVQCGTYL